MECEINSASGPLQKSMFAWVHVYAHVFISEHAKLPTLPPFNDTSCLPLASALLIHWKQHHGCTAA